jgi:polysaccharide chain length determinant protein (PEP-CTERM system associated)
MNVSTSVPGLQPYVDLLRRRRRVALWSGLATFVLCGAFALGLPALYRASATLTVQGPMPTDLVPASVSGEINTRLQLLKREALSRGRATALIERFRLYGHQPGAPVSEGAMARLERDVVTEVTSDTTRAQPTAVAFTVSYAADNPRTAAEVTNALAAFYVDHNAETRARQASATAATIAAQIEAKRADLEAQSARIGAYTSRNMGALPQQMEANLSAISRLDAQFQRNADELLRQGEHRQRLQSQMATIDTRVPAPDENTPASRLARAEAELADLRSRFADTYPDVRAKQFEVETLRRELGSAGRGGSGRAAATPRAAVEQALRETEANIASLEREQASLESQIRMYQRRVETAPAHEPAFDGLVREYEATRAQLDALQRRHDDALLAERAESGEVTQELRVLDAAVPPVLPTGPARGLLLGLSFILALAVGIGAAVAVDWTDTSFHTIDDLRAFTKVPVLASIPEIAVTAPSARMRGLALAGVRLVALGALAFGAFHLAHYGEGVVRVLSRVG